MCAVWCKGVEDGEMGGRCVQCVGWVTYAVWCKELEDGEMGGRCVQCGVCLWCEGVGDRDLLVRWVGDVCSVVLCVCGVRGWEMVTCW